MACVEGLSHRWSWWAGEEDNPPDVDDLAVHPDTGSCYRVTSIKPSSRKGQGWYVMHVEGLGAGAATLGEEGTFGYKRLTHADHEAIRMIEAARRLDAQSEVVN